jgi:aldehyde:ferredoxin oxidoreductase
MKFIRVNMTDKSVNVEDVPEGYMGLGGRGLTSIMINAEVPALGTAGMVAPVNSMGAFPSYNATKGVFDGWEKFSGEALTKIIEERGGNPKHMGCAQCIVHCSNEFVDKKGEI